MQDAACKRRYRKIWLLTDGKTIFGDYQFKPIFKTEAAAQEHLETNKKLFMQGSFYDRAKVIGFYLVPDAYMYELTGDPEHQ